MADSEFLFNMDHGYLEGLCRGFRSGILTQGDYLNLVQCETLEGSVSVKNYLPLLVPYICIRSYWIRYHFVDNFIDHLDNNHVEKHYFRNIKVKKH